jgi:RNA polymerase primary sigma factor
MITMTERATSKCTRVALRKRTALRAFRESRRGKTQAGQAPVVRANKASLQERAQRLRSQDLPFMDHPAFHREGLGLPAELQPALDGSCAAKAPNRASSASGASAAVAGLGETPLLSKQQEAFLFCRMNYLKFRAVRVAGQLDAEDPSPRLVEQVERFLSEALEIRNQLVRANLRLIVFVAKDFADRHNTLPELVSDGTIALMRAVEKFDFARGNRFSTYATWAIRNHFIRLLETNRKHRQRHLSGYQEKLDFSCQEDDVLPHANAAAVEKYEYVEELLEHLNDRERVVITGRFALTVDGKKRTLEEIGETLGISKERVRQISERALEKLRDLAQMQPPELLDL